MNVLGLRLFPHEDDLEPLLAQGLGAVRVEHCLPALQAAGGAGGGTIANSNYGCATNANMAAMVANPADLVRGQRRDTNDPLTASKAINAYRNAAPSGAGGSLGSGGGASAAGGSSGSSGSSSGGGR